MKKLTTSTFLLLIGSLFILPVQAHDPALHMENAEKPKCGAMKNMDHSKMDANDPVMLALMKKCKNAAADSSSHEGHKANKSDSGLKENKQEMKHDDRQH